MPLITQILREGANLQLENGWGGFHIGVLVYAASLDSGIGPFEDNSVKGILGAELAKRVEADRDYQIPLPHKLWFPCSLGYGPVSHTPLNSGGYPLKSKWTFLDPSDGEIVRLLPADVLHAYRH